MTPLNGQFGASHIPIIGQSFAVEGLILQVVIRCKCQPPGQEQVLVLIGLPGQMRAQCPQCRRMYTLVDTVPSILGEVDFKWAIGAPRESAEQAAEASSAS